MNPDINARIRNVSPAVLFILILLCLDIGAVVSFFATEGSSLVFLFGGDSDITFMDWFDTASKSMTGGYNNGVFYTPFFILLLSVFGNTSMKFSTPISDFDLAHTLRAEQFSIMVFLILVLLVICLLHMYAVRLVSRSNSHNIAELFSITLLLTYPILFSLGMGNISFFTLALCMVFVFNYRAENRYVRVLSLVSLIIASALNLCSLFLVLLLLRDKEYKDSFGVLVLSIIFAFLPILCVEGTINQYFENIIAYSEQLVVSGNICNIPTMVSCVVGHYDLVLSAVLSISFFAVCAGIILADHALYDWKVMLLITGCMMLVPSTSTSANLVYLILPLLCFISSVSEKKGFNILCLIMFIAIFCTLPGFESGIFFYSISKSMITLVFTLVIMLESLVNLYKAHDSKKAPNLGFDGDSEC